jgi:hypothetical protein
MKHIHFVIYRLKSIITIYLLLFLFYFYFINSLFFVVYSEIEFIKPLNDVKIQRKTITFTKYKYNIFCKTVTDIPIFLFNYQRYSFFLFNCQKNSEKFKNSIIFALSNMRVAIFIVCYYYLLFLYVFCIMC